MENSHISYQIISQFVSGQLDEDDSNRITAHISECDYCLSIADKLWAKQPVEEAVLQIVDLDPDTAERLEQRITNQIHRSNLAGTIVNLSTKGFMSVVIGLLRPLVISRVNLNTEGENND